MLGLPFFRLRWLVAAAIAAAAWTHFQGPPELSPRRGHQATPRPSAALPARIALPAPRPSARADRPRRLVTGAIPAIPAPRPKAAVGAVKTAAAAPGTARPLRKPQAGDCQCPYDVMVTGKRCGEHSALGRGKVARSACYR